MFSLLALPLFRLWQRAGPPALHVAGTHIVARGGWVLMVALWFGALEAIFRPGWPGSLNLVDDWANFTVHLCCFMFGHLPAPTDGLSTPHYAPLTAATYLLMHAPLSIWSRWALSVAISWAAVALITWVSRLLPPLRWFFGIRAPDARPEQSRMDARVIRVGAPSGRDSAGPPAMRPVARAPSAVTHSLERHRHRAHQGVAHRRV